VKIYTILDHIDSGHMALPEFQRGYVWNREQVRKLFTALYKRHPVGGLLVWATDSGVAEYRGDQPVAAGIVKLLLDGQQRMTSLYGVIRGKPPAFFDGNAEAFTGLRFNVETETFEFYQPVKMRDDPNWIDVTELMRAGNAGLGTFVATLSRDPVRALKVGDYVARLSRLLGVTEVELHIDEVTGADKTLDIVVDIFNEVNSGGTKLSKGDLALAKICADWPEARAAMKAKLKDWTAAGYEFNLDWLLRSVNTVLTGEAKFIFLHDKTATEVEEALRRATKHIDTCLNFIAARLGLDHARVLFGRFALPVMVRYLDQRSGTLGASERDKLLFWFAAAGMWGRYSGSTESFLDRDLEMLEGPDGGLDKLLQELRLWHGALGVEPGHFDGWSLGARFYPVLYMLTRMGDARDWGLGIPLKASLLGRMNRLEVHHIFPKSQLYKRKVEKRDVNAIANFCFLTKDTNLDISNRLPKDYFAEVEAAHPGALASQWVPMDRSLWEIDNYADFLAERRRLLAQEANGRLAELLHGDMTWIEGTPVPAALARVVLGGIASDTEEAELQAINAWVVAQGLPAGEVGLDYADADTGEQMAVFDLAWTEGLQPGLSSPVVLLLNEGEDTLALASAAGFRCFTDTGAFKTYVRHDVLGERAAA
jgi:hypothetical protein